MEILHRNTKWVKLNRNKIIRGELSNREKVFNNIRSYKNVVEMKGTRKSRVAGANDR